MALAHAADQRCRAGAASQRFQPLLPRAVQSLRETGQLSIVTIGSSTTAGAGASAEDKSYPAMLQDELRRRLPQAEIRVINRGVGGQSAFDMVSRMDTDVIDKAPGLVIWQTVAADVVNHIGEDKLAKILKKGIRKVQAAGIDLVMMDLPWLPREGRYPHYDDYRGVLKTVAAEFSVPVFPRYGMMREWAQSRRFTAEELIGMDGTELVEAGYRCLAIRIADGVASALSGPRVERPAAPRPTN
ncbi:MAG: GDSL-type esterase/lipase family protein [Bosea sp. (in: a-proteobacteria)]|jgi:acyl-CoA thioesterase I|uniref:SGNH/GDSL hydrolase family protein n=1 Tax=Bosea sp. (in: a-proteobacteria) TaxID=1871050 RepID=UPI00273635A6|nr:GDSL-type esterase/lipase family protein [Bosea sp. (in: a-proteobacteria)]MDP3601797.1 GDSL-type esterase/lipase family protein [Bosea sp. (in: a-proteobacteria)]